VELPENFLKGLPASKRKMKAKHLKMISSSRKDGKMQHFKMLKEKFAREYLKEQNKFKQKMHGAAAKKSRIVQAPADDS
jgi:hypothetical protein